MKKPIPFGKYYLLERINVGGMAEVFRAKAYGVEGFERLVAVKRILPNIAEDTEFIKMFIDEAKIAVQLNHANIAQIFDLGMVDGSYYIALEHIHGRDLRAIFDRCRNHGEPMPVAQACFVVMKVCEGLDYAHNKRDSSGRPLNLVHRDVSPQNIIVSFEGEVKLIDFGIAKAAGKGSKTQAGILKGKFGYMSPEQVRGLPIDRRSDIFSCGIVLYELLTGERLFVGESDFSTLEKVRNVEILPPSTYNRKIPDELERIVLKALAKDHDDRYQNAIDLHDELQAFVYTAGEFYSRKDLAGWSKRVFAREIKEETAKLESYKELRPPEQTGAQPRRKPGKPTAPLRATLAMPTVAPAPPPIPRRGNGAGAVAAVAAAAPAAAGLEWDDDELETQIYEGGPEELEPAPVPPAPAPTGAAGGLAAAEDHEPDLSSLVQTAKGWGGGPGGPGAVAPREAAPPVNLASGSSNTPSPFPEEEPLAATAEAPATADPRDPSAVVRLVNMAQPIFENSFDANPAYAPPPQAKSRTMLYVAIAAAVIILAGGGAGLYFALSGGGNRVAEAETTTDQTAGAAAGAVDDQGSSALPLAPHANPPASDLAPEVLKETGFDLYVEPAAIKEQVTIKVDGKLYATAPPARFRQIAPGDHTIEIEAPRPYKSEKEVVTVTAGEAGRVTIRLSADQVVAHFESTPPGADVVLVSDGARTPLGKSPTEAKLDPAKRYEVIFERSGYVGQTKPIEFSGRPEESIVAILARAPSVAHDRSSTSNHSSGTRVADRSPPTRTTPRNTDRSPKHDTTASTDHGSSNPFADDSDVGKRPPKDTSPPAPRGTGSINIGSKPPCKIYIDGKNTGKMTPQRGLKLPAGRHKVTLVNNTYNIKETFSVTVKANDSSTVMKNMMDRIKK